MQLVTSSCNQCEQNAHTRCPAESLARQGFIENPGDHCFCASQNHPTPQTEKEVPRIKSMLGKQKEERDIPESNREITEEKEADSIESDDD